MAAQVPRWPVRQPHVAGNDLTCVVNMPAETDLTGAAWQAVIRYWPRGAPITQFDVDTDEANHRLILTLPPAESILLRPGMGFDLTQLTPVERTIFTVEELNVVGAYSHGST